MLINKTNSFTFISVWILCTFISEMAAINSNTVDVILKEIILPQEKNGGKKALISDNETESFTPDLKTNECGNNVECKLKSRGEKLNHCKAGYAEKFGQCVACDCGPGGHECEFDILGAQRCNCKEGYGIKLDGRCTDCDCGPGGHDCEFDLLGARSCNCKAGYVLNLGGRCTDINECLENNPCLHINTTVCKNLLGSFQCICKEGYHSKPNSLSPQIFGCDPDQPNQPKWKIPLIVCGAVFFFIFVTAGIVILVKKCRSRSTSKETV